MSLILQTYVPTSIFNYLAHLAHLTHLTQHTIITLIPSCVQPTPPFPLTLYTSQTAGTLAARFFSFLCSNIYPAYFSNVSRYQITAISVLATLLTPSSRCYVHINVQTDVLCILICYEEICMRANFSFKFIQMTKSSLTSTIYASSHSIILKTMDGSNISTQQRSSQWQELEAGSIPSRVRRVAFHPGMITAPHLLSSQGLTYIDDIFQNSMLIISTVCPPSSSTSPSVLNSTNQWATIFLPLSPT